MSKSTNAEPHSAVVTRSAGRTVHFLRTQLWTWPLLASAILVFVGFWVRLRMEEAIRREIGSNLATVRNANAEALRAWAASMRSQAELLAQEEQTRGLIQHLLIRIHQPEASRAALVAAPEFAALRGHLKPVEEGHGFAGYAVLDTNFTVVAAGQEQFVGLAPPSAYAKRLATCLAGSATVTPPFAGIELPSGQPGVSRSAAPLMFAAAPVRSAGGQVIAVLAFRILPEKDFTRILATARSGASGETYAFDRDGLLLSESRFDEELKRLGLIPDSANAQSLLALDLRDPLVDLREGRRLPTRRTELPFTKAVIEALAQRDGVDLRGYRDYRGVPVVGAWAWLPDFQMGLVTELDEAEALVPVRILRQGFWFLFALLAAGSAVVFVLMILAHRQALKATQLGQYTLGEELGVGAYGTVFRARHALMRRPVALKVLNPLAGPQAIVRFEREVQLTCQLTHPNTIALYDYGHTQNGLFYYVMEYLDGISLSQLIKQFGPQPEGRVIHILRQVCASLAEAHSMGLVHRDIKPQNIFLTHRGGIPDFVKVLDFGLVKARQPSAELELTTSNAKLGTPLYMSPEAIGRPDTVDAMSDLYSLGMVGYELLTGEPAFGGTSISEVLMQQLRAKPQTPSARLKHPVSPDLESLVMQCLAKKPSARPASAAALEEALGSCAAASSWSPETAKQWWAGHLPPPGSRAEAA